MTFKQRKKKREGPSFTQIQSVTLKPFSTLPKMFQFLVLKSGTFKNEDN